jgi:hypothetical protein
MRTEVKNVVNTAGSTPNRGIGGIAYSGLAQSIAAGAVAALVGAVLWAVFVEASGYELGIVAVGIGFLVGQAMAVTAGASDRLPPIGAVLALVGCLLGNAFVDAHELAKVVGGSTGNVLHRMISDPHLAGEVFKAGFRTFDLVFWAIAAYEGYKLTARGVARVRQQPVVTNYPTAYPPAPLHPGFATPPKPAPTDTPPPPAG